MRGFIEVTQTNGKAVLINTRFIEEVQDNTIYFAFNLPNADEQDYIKCRETYEEIKMKIERAISDYYCD